MDCLKSATHLKISRSGFKSILLKLDQTANLKEKMAHFLEPYFLLENVACEDESVVNIEYRQISHKEWECLLSMDWQSGYVFFDRPSSSIVGISVGEVLYLRDLTDTEKVVYSYCNGTSKWKVQQFVQDTCEFSMCLERLVRKVFQTQMNDINIATVHGSCVSKRGKSIIFVGDKKAGKTSTILKLIDSGFGFVSNDKTTIDFQSGLAVGWPNSLNIRTDTLTTFFGDNEINFTVYDSVTETYVPKEYLREGTITVSVKELFKLLGCEQNICASGILNAVVFPHFKDGISESSIEVMSTEEGEALLRPHVLTNFSSSIEGEKFLKLPPFGSEIKFYKLYQNFSTLSSTVTLIESLIGQESLIFNAL